MRADDSLEPFQPEADDPWDREHAVHLALRTGFGATPEEVQQLLDLGPEAAVEARVRCAGEDPELDRTGPRLGEPLYEYAPDEEGGAARVHDARAWWIWRMCAAQHPLVERLTLFWHAHFACQESDELSLALLLQQNELLRRLGSGRFRELLVAIARDPAMLVFLDGRRNVRESPNENWARELMELFTLGLDRYTQHDVREIARAFTGWGLGVGRNPQFEFHPQHHDEGEKRVLGRLVRGRSGTAGIEEGDEILAALLQEPCSAEFLARKLLRWFVEDDPSPELCAAAGARLRDVDGVLGEFLGVLLRSRAFHARRRHASLFKTPASFVVSAVRGLGVQNPQLLPLGDRMRELGMDLFHPPSVAGWELGEAWIHAGSVLLRARFAEELAQLPHSGREVSGSPAIDLDALAAGARGSVELVRGLARRLIAHALPEPRLRSLARRVDGLASREPHARTRAAIRLVLSAPEFALE